MTETNVFNLVVSGWCFNGFADVLVTPTCIVQMLPHLRSLVPSHIHPVTCRLENSALLSWEMLTDISPDAVYAQAVDVSMFDKYVYCIVSLNQGHPPERQSTFGERGVNLKLYFFVQMRGEKTLWIQAIESDSVSAWLRVFVMHLLGCCAGALETTSLRHWVGGPHTDEMFGNKPHIFIVRLKFGYIVWRHLVIRV